MNTKLSDIERATISHGRCPDCHYRGFVLGPRGGAAMNIECGGCRARFNITTFPFSHHVALAERIPSQEDGGADWGL